MVLTPRVVRERLYRALDTIDGEPMELEWHISQDSPRCSSATNVQEFLSKMSEEPEEFTGRIIFMSMFNDISWGSQDNEHECELNAQLVSLYAKRLGGRTTVIPRTWIRKEVVFHS